MKQMLLLWDLHASTGEIWIFWDECPREWSHQRKHGRTRTLMKAVWKKRRWPFRMFFNLPPWPVSLPQCWGGAEPAAGIGNGKGKAEGVGMGWFCCLQTLLWLGQQSSCILPWVGACAASPSLVSLQGFFAMPGKNRAHQPGCELQLANTVSKRTHQDEKWG